MEKVLLKVDGMSCSHCEKSVKNALENIGVSETKVDLTAGTVTVTFDSNKVTIDRIKFEIDDIGYEVK